MKNAERKANAQTKKSKERKYSEGEKAHECARIERLSFRNLPFVPFIPSWVLLEEPRVR